MLEADFPEPRLEMRDGMWVMTGGPPVNYDAVEFIDEQRERRMQFVAGLSDEP
jgi:hypothetical protein